MEVTDSDKHSNLLWYGINYVPKKFYSIGPWHISICHTYADYVIKRLKFFGNYLKIWKKLIQAGPVLQIFLR
jgi:hypothetical protein